MLEQRFRISHYPVRIAKDSENKYIMFSTKTLESIFLDNLCINIFNYMRDKANFSIHEVLTYLKENSLMGYTGADIHKDVENFVLFLESKQFVVSC
jgi:hypothetical protein